MIDGAKEHTALMVDSSVVMTDTTQVSNAIIVVISMCVSRCVRVQHGFLAMRTNKIARIDFVWKEGSLKHNNPS